MFILFYENIKLIEYSFKNLYLENIYQNEALKTSMN